MEIINKLLEAIELLKQILQELKVHNEKFNEYVYNLNQIQRR